MAETKVMGRIKRNIIVGERECWTLFDSGAMNNFVVEEVARLGVVAPLSTTRTTRLGGGVHRINRSCVLDCMVEGKPVDLYAHVVPSIGPDENGKRIEIIFGAQEMQRWGIVLDLRAERLDMTHYPVDGFYEYLEARL